MKTRIALCLAAVLGGGVWLWSAQAQSGPVPPPTAGLRGYLYKMVVHRLPNFAVVGDQDAEADILKLYPDWEVVSVDPQRKMMMSQPNKEGGPGEVPVMVYTLRKPR